jgi:hypothetical protein
VCRGWKGGESKKKKDCCTRTRFERERGDVDDDYGTRLEDGEEHADLARDAGDYRVVCARMWWCQWGPGARGCLSRLAASYPIFARAKVEPFHERRSGTLHGGSAASASARYTGRPLSIQLSCPESFDSEKVRTHRHVPAIGP